MKPIKCSSCDNVDFQYRYAKMVFFDGADGQICANCFTEWIEVNRSNEKAKFKEMMEYKR